MKACWINGVFGGSISPYDAGFLTGHGVFETMGVFGGKLPLWQAHLRRLEANASKLLIPFDLPAHLESSALSLLAKEPDDDILRLTLTAGVDDQPTWCMTTRRRVASDGPQLLRVLDMVRRSEDPLASVKTTSYAFHILARRAAENLGAADALLMGENDQILETTSGNIYFWRRGELCTPSLDGRVLPGVGRGALLSTLEYMGVNVAQSIYTLSDLADHEGLFTTNAVHGPRPAILSAGETASLAPVIVEAWQRATA